MSLEELEMQGLLRIKAALIKRLERLNTALINEPSVSHQMKLESEIKEAESNQAQNELRIAALAARMAGVLGPPTSPGPGPAAPQCRKPERPPTRQSLHLLIRRMLSDDRRLSLFCCTYYPRVFATFASGQNHDDRMLQLLARESEDWEALIDRLAQFDADSFCRFRSLLIEEK